MTQESTPPPRNNATPWDAIVNGIEAFGQIFRDVNWFKSILLVLIVGIAAYTVISIYGKNQVSGQITNPIPTDRLAKPHSHTSPTAPAVPQATHTVKMGNIEDHSEVDAEQKAGPHGSTSLETKDVKRSVVKIKQTN